MGVTTTKTNKPLNPRGNDGSPLKYNRAKLFSGKALDFDGVNDYVEVADNANLSFGNGTTDSPFSITGYFNLDTLGANQTIAAKDNLTNREYSLFVTTNNQLRFFIKNNGGGNQQSIDSDLVLESGKWYFVSATYDGRGGDTAYQGLNIYVNGQLTGVSIFTDSSYTAMANTTAPFTAGVYGSAWMNGQLSNIKVFAGELTSAQVADLYNNPELVVPTGVANTALKLWLPMQEGAGTTAYDGSGNGNHGTISGATYTHGIGAPVSQTAIIDWNKGVNYLAYSEQMSTGWAKQNVTLTQNALEAPNGLTTAIKFTASAADTFHLDSQTNASAAAGIWKQSVFAKAGEVDFAFLVIRVDGGTNRYGVKFDLTDGTFVDDFISGSPTNTDYEITDAGNGWYKCTIQASHTSGNITAVYGPNIAGNLADINGAHLGDGVSGMYMWGASLRPSTDSDSYVRTETSTQTSPVLLPQGLTTGRDITGVNLFENVRKQGALNLDGNSWAEVHDNASLDFGTGDLTIECWSKATYENTGSGVNVLMSLGGDLTNGNTSAIVTTSTSFSFYLGGSSTLISGYVTGQWYHIVGVRNGSSIYIYINGSLENSKTQSGTITNEHAKQIGRDSTTDRSYKDQIAQPRIYNRALTAAEVLQNYNSGKNTYTNN